MTRRSSESLRAQHRRCDHLFDDLLNRAESGDWRECDAIWGEFETTLEEHMRHEEAHLFPLLARSGPVGEEQVERLLEDHAAFRKAMVGMGLDIEVHCIRLASVDQLVTRLRSHARTEDGCLYPWADLRDAGDVPPPPRMDIPTAPIT